jgi:hypothetical protein
VACAAIDLTLIGTADMTPEQWYSSVIDSIVSSLELYETFELYDWWEQHKLLSYVRRFDKFIDEILLPSIAESIVIFVDEIDSILSLPFQLDDFLALIREFYNRRADNADYNRLTFTLLGVTTPADLIQDKQRTPFNIGVPIDLTGFQLPEAAPLLPGLAAKMGQAEAMLAAVLEWTGGQPFLTQKLCKLLRSAADPPTEQTTAAQAVAWVAQVVQTQVIDNWEAQDIPQHLRTIRDRLLCNEHLAWKLLEQYSYILHQKDSFINAFPEYTELCLSGLVVKRMGKIHIYNRIYKHVFNQYWIDKELNDLKLDSRIKSIVEGIGQSLREGRRLKDLDSHDPYYLNQVPHLWLKKYPLDSRELLTANQQDYLQETQEIKERVSVHSPQAQILSSDQFKSILESLHTISQEASPQDERQDFSKDIADYIRQRLINSGAVTSCTDFEGVTYYTLVRASYSPSDEKERLYVTVEDAARYFQLLRDWKERKPNSMRVVEWLDIPPEKINQALRELDDLIINWVGRKAP